LSRNPRAPARSARVQVAGCFQAGQDQQGGGHDLVTGCQCGGHLDVWFQA